MPRISNRLLLSIGIFIITYALTMGLRLYEAPAWDNPSLSIQGEKLLATHDAYHWLAEAKDVGRKKSAPLAEMTQAIYSLTGIQYANLAFWLPAFIAPFAVIPLILLGRHWRLEEGALTAGVLAAGCLGFLLRSRLGFYDTDILALFFPLLMYVLLIIVFAPFLRKTWAKTEENIRDLGWNTLWRFLLQAVGVGLAGLIYMWFYSNASPVLLASLGALIVCILLLTPNWLQTVWLLVGLMIILGLSLGGPASWLGIAAWFWILWRKRQWLEEKTGLKWAVIALGCIVIIDANLLGIVWSGVMKVLGYAKIFTADIRREGDLSLPMVGQSIREAQNIDWGRIIHRVAGHWAIFVAGLLGFGYVLYRFPLSLIFVPLLGMSLFSFTLGNRFTMYGGSVLGVGLGFGLSLILLRMNIRKSLRVVVQMALCVVVLLPSYHTATGLRPAPILPQQYAKTFLEIKEQTQQNARLWPWWDYGYAGQYYAERITFGDGGVHGGNVLYPAAKVHMTHSPRQARQIMQYITVSQEEEFAANSTKYKDMNEFWKPYLADPVAELEELGPEGARDFVRSLAEKEFDWPGDQPPQYLVLSWENMRLAYWISYFGTWDLVTGGADPGRIKQVRGKAGFDLDKGVINLSKGQVTLAGLDVLDPKNPRHFEWPNTSRVYAVLNRLSQELYLMDEKIYKSMMVQMLIRDPKKFEQDFELVVDKYPWNRAYRVQSSD